MTDHEPISSPTPPLRRRAPVSRKVLIVAAVLIAGLSGAVATKAFSHGFGPGFGPGGWGPHFSHMDGPMSPAQIEERADRMVRHLAVEVDATGDQTEKLRVIVRNAVKDIVPARERVFAARQQARDLLTQQTVDRAALEKLRAEQIATADTVSKRLVQALADAAEILTPEQRRKLNEHFPPMGSRWRPWHRG
ncbi:MAG: periplasmic heavy metal sensor [Pseudorhodoplanes sp.]|nr:periplasmic heavy metal sensor [Pseudorhodoplanes sp.]